MAEAVRPAERKPESGTELSFLGAEGEFPSRTAAGATEVPFLSNSGSQLRASFPPLGHMAMSGGIFDCHEWGVRATGT